jgi:prefoldin subunit 5
MSAPPSPAPVAAPPPAPAPAPSVQSVIADATTTAILTAVEQQLTRYFGAMAARADAVQQAGDAGRAEIVTHFQQQIDLLRMELERSQQTNDAYERALQTAIEERLTEFAASQHWRFSEVEGRLDRVAEEVTLGPTALIEAATAPIIQRVDTTAEVLASRIEELQTAARRFDEQSSALVQHLNDTTTGLSRRLDEAYRAVNANVDERTLTFSQRVDDAVSTMRSHVGEQAAGFARKFEDIDNRLVDRMLAMEERINEHTGVRLAGVEATIGRISGGIDEAIVALSHRVIELESSNHDMMAKLDVVVEQMNQVDEEAINQLREQMSSAVGESMLVRIELERVASSTGEQFDKINVRMGELAAQIADTDLDVSTAVQLERLEEIERALSELDPAQFVRKGELPGPGGHAVAGQPFSEPPTTAPDGAPDPTTHTSTSESNLSSW